GDPIIPREVRLSEGSELRGWQAGFLGESQPPFANDIPDPAATAAGHDAFDWSLENGVLRAGRRNPQPGVSAQSLLCYQRPLLDGESISYEYHYEPGQLEVHPALGRLAFLIEPGGVRIRWITD